MLLTGCGHGVSSSEHVSRPPRSIEEDPGVNGKALWPIAQGIGGRRERRDCQGATASEGDPPKEQTGQSKLQERGLTRKSGDRWRRGKATLQENIGGLLCQQTLKSYADLWLCLFTAYSISSLQATTKRFACYYHWEVLTTQSDIAQCHYPLTIKSTEGIQHCAVSTDCDNKIGTKYICLYRQTYLKDHIQYIVDVLHELCDQYWMVMDVEIIPSISWEQLQWHKTRRLRAWGNWLWDD